LVANGRIKKVQMSQKKNSAEEKKDSARGVRPNEGKRKSIITSADTVQKHYGKKGGRKSKKEKLSEGGDEEI